MTRSRRGKPCLCVNEPISPVTREEGLETGERVVKLDARELHRFLGHGLRSMKAIGSLGHGNCDSGLAGPCFLMFVLMPNEAEDAD